MGGSEIFISIKCREINAQVCGNLKSVVGRPNFAVTAQDVGVITPGMYSVMREDSSKAQTVPILPETIADDKVPFVFAEDGSEWQLALMSHQVQKYRTTYTARITPDLFGLAP
jgi:hypothetical protein